MKIANQPCTYLKKNPSWKFFVHKQYQAQNRVFFFFKFLRNFSKRINGKIWSKNFTFEKQRMSLHSTLTKKMKEKLVSNVFSHYSNYTKHFYKLERSFCLCLLYWIIFASQKQDKLPTEHEMTWTYRPFNQLELKARLYFQNSCMQTFLLCSDYLILHHTFRIYISIRIIF